MGRMEWSEGGGKWDNCNSIINKYIFLKKRGYSGMNFEINPRGFSGRLDVVYGRKRNLGRAF